MQKLLGIVHGIRRSNMPSAPQSHHHRCTVQQRLVLIFLFLGFLLTLCLCTSLPTGRVRQERLGVVLERVDEMQCLVSGCNFLLRAIYHEAFSFEKGDGPNYVTPHCAHCPFAPYLAHMLQSLSPVRLSQKLCSHHLRLYHIS